MHVCPIMLLSLQKGAGLVCQKHATLMGSSVTTHNDTAMTDWSSVSVCNQFIRMESATRAMKTHHSHLYIYMFGPSVRKMSLLLLSDQTPLL